MWITATQQRIKIAWDVKFFWVRIRITTWDRRWASALITYFYQRKVVKLRILFF